MHGDPWAKIRDRTLFLLVDITATETKTADRQTLQGREEVSSTFHRSTELGRGRRKQNGTV